MANPKNPEAYSQMWWNLLDAFEQNEEGFSLQFATREDATKMRFRFYAFREALKRGAKLKGSDMGKKCADAILVATKMKALLRDEKDGTCSMLIRPSSRIIQTEEMAVQGQLMTLLAKDKGPEVAEESGAEEMEEVSSLDVLGFK